MPESDFNGKVIWITGASSGIGEALAKRFARTGCQLILSSRQEDQLRRVAADCSGAKSVSVVPLDLSKPETMQAAVGKALALAGQIDIMVHNGGVSQRAFAAETLYEVDERIMRTNYLGPVALTKALLPSMNTRRQGHFIVVSSVLGKFGLPGRSAYSASKHALHGFFDTLRAETWENSIHVTMVLPGWVQTNVSKNALTGNGTPHGVTGAGTAGGVTPEYCAGKIVRAARSRNQEVYVVQPREQFALYLNRFAPGLLRRFLRGRVI